VRWGDGVVGNEVSITRENSVRVGLHGEFTCRLADLSAQLNVLLQYAQPIPFGTPPRVGPKLLFCLRLPSALCGGRLTVRLQKAAV